MLMSDVGGVPSGGYLSTPRRKKQGSSAVPRGWRTTNAMKILQMGSISARFDEDLAQRHDVTRLWLADDRERTLEEQGPHVELLVTSPRFGADRALLERLPKLRAICNYGVGYDTVDVGWAAEHGIPVSNTPDVLTDCVADLAIGLLIAAVRRIPQLDRFVREGRWGRDRVPLTGRVSGKRLGIVGMGRIGEAVARRAAGFDLEIAYTGARPSRRARPHHRFEPSLLALASWADFLLLTCPGGASTFRMVSRPVLEALGPEGLLVNVSRGSVVDEEALIAVLREGKLGAAALDVFENEPGAPAELIEMENVVLLPHVASATIETRTRMAELVAENVEAFSRTGELVTPI
jgi:hydroxypyruvate reductase